MKLSHSGYGAIGDRMVIWAAMLLGFSLWVLPAASIAQPQSLAGVQPATGLSRLEGEGQLRFLGLRIYDARLWVGPQFNARAYAEHPLALELIYHRAFRGSSIAERSMQEINRQQTLDAAQAARWQQLLGQWLPDVQPGDRLVGLYTPGRGMRLWRGDEALGTLNDAELARRFVDIWLSAKTSEPSLRSALLASSSGGVP